MKFGLITLRGRVASGKRTTPTNQPTAKSDCYNLEDLFIGAIEEKA